jgi:hypothetical protein
MPRGEGAVPATASGAHVEVAACLERLEAALDLDWEREKLAAWRRFLAFEPRPGGMRPRESAGGGGEPGEWPAVLVNEASRDRGLMLVRQLGEVYEAACRRLWRIPNIRTNYGTGVLSSLFGAELFWMPDELDTLPTTRALEGPDPLGQLLAAGEPDLEAGWGARVFETAAYFKAQLAPFPKLSEAVWIYHPDLQGPMDIAELMLGADLLVAFYDRPDDVKAALELITGTYVRFLRRWFALVPPRDGAKYMAHWGKFFRGQVMLREDSLVNLSPEMYVEFVRPCDQRILDEFGGGAVHFCGKCDHVTHLMAEQKGLTAINPSQPELNDARRLYAHTIGRGIVLDTPTRVLDLLDADFSHGLITY